MAESLESLIADAWDAWHPVSEGHSGKPWEFMAKFLAPHVVLRSELEQVGWWSRRGMPSGQHIAGMNDEYDWTGWVPVFVERSAASGTSSGDSDRGAT